MSILSKSNIKKGLARPSVNFFVGCFGFSTAYVFILETLFREVTPLVIPAQYKLANTSVIVLLILVAVVDIPIALLGGFLSIRLKPKPNTILRVIVYYILGLFVGIILAGFQIPYLATSSIAGFCIFASIMVIIRKRDLTSPRVWIYGLIGVILYGVGPYFLEPDTGLFFSLVSSTISFSAALITSIVISREINTVIQQ